MRLVRIQARGFRNLATEPVDVDAPLVVFAGGNGQGKTNWLEAVGVLGTLRSFRTARPAEMVAWGAAAAEVEAVGVSEGMTRTWSWKWADGARALRRDDRTVDAIGWLSSLRATWFVPTDVLLVRGEPALRRAALDRAVLAWRPAYLALARDTKRVLDHKAALLRGPSDGQLDVIDTQLAALATQVTLARAETVARMAEPFARAYAALAPGEAATVRYGPWLGEGDATTLEARCVDRLRKARSGELGAGRLLAGPQRDDLVFTVLDRPARAYASQGQARSLVLAWKLAELDAARSAGETPLFLLDDLGSELDPARTARLVELLGHLGAQVFVTTTDPRYVPESAAPRVITVENGVAMRTSGESAEGTPAS